MDPPLPDLPRALEVKKFAEARGPEVQALEAALKSSEAVHFGALALPRQLRRRTRTHTSYKHFRRPNKRLTARRLAAKADQLTLPQPVSPGSAHDNGSAAQAGWEALVCRRMRRARGPMQAREEASCCQEPVPGGKRRLETHTWHAKRFKMTQRWGTCLAEGVVGKGHGSRALLASMHNGCLLHDASYWCPVQLTASLPQLASTLQLLRALPCSEGKLTTGQEWRIVLHIIPGTSQEKRSTAICPASALLLPPSEAQSAGVPSKEHRLLLWLHPAAYQDAVAALKAASQQSGAVLQSRLHALRRLELLGPGSFKLLQHLLSGAKITPDMLFGQAVSLMIPDQRLRLPEHGLVLRCQSALTGEAPAARLSAVGLSADEADAEQAAAQEGCSASCPATLIPHTSDGPNTPQGFSLILQSRWVLPMWRAFTFAGSVRVCGQREWRWAASALMHPSFPWDYPDTAAGAAELEVQDAEEGRKAALRPKNRFMFRSTQWAWQLLAASLQGQGLADGNILPAGISLQHDQSAHGGMASPSQRQTSRG
ncbi:hypothetical protein WJX73_006734 [Symbiochloris irregularis]|uniref:Uncharacterized protein n=1 Tax=Symbiochloris irregularis TaxID=706552 RepID=A0AAW1NXB7_9CHLO